MTSFPFVTLFLESTLGSFEGPFTLNSTSVSSAKQTMISTRHNSFQTCYLFLDKINETRWPIFTLIWLTKLISHQIGEAFLTISYQAFQCPTFISKVPQQSQNFITDREENTNEIQNASNTFHHHKISNHFIKVGIFKPKEVIRMFGFIMTEQCCYCGNFHEKYSGLK